jgi:hypothetical protein
MLARKCCLPYASKDTLLFVSKLCGTTTLRLGPCLFYGMCGGIRAKNTQHANGMERSSLGGKGSSDCT